jgi:protocatechuate 3,4-dioxygenase beta subunit
VTDAAGGYTLRGAGGRSLEILGGAPGYLRPDPASYFFAPDVRSAPTLALKPGAAIEGLVVDEAGQPVAGADASLSVKQDPGRMVIRMGAEPAVPRAVSSSRGSFRISPVDPEKNYDMKVAATGFAPLTKDILGLEARRTMSGVRIEMSRGQSVAGQILDKDGKPVRDADASLRPASRGARMGGMMIEGPGGGGGSAFKAASDGDGKFRITGVSAGTYDLEVRHGGYAAKTVPGIEVPKKAEPVDVGSISLDPGARVNGLVSAPDGSPIEGVEIAIMKASSGPVMMAGRGAPGTTPAAVTGADGRFALDDLESGKPVNLSFSRAGWVRKTESGVEPPKTDPLLVTLEPASKVSGRVLGPDKKPVAGAVVNLTRTQSGGIGNQAFKMIMRESDNADDDGFFLFDNVSPGQISLGAVASGWQEAEMDGVDVPQGKDVTGIEIPLKAGSVVAGRVLGPDGRPAIGASLGLVKDDPEPFRFGGTVSDGDGNYRIEGLVPGTFSIEATHDDFVRTVKEIAARPGTNKLDLQFEGGQEVAGSVTDAAGNPLAGVLLSLDAPGREYGGPEAHSAGDGGFKFLGVGDGDYSLRAMREGFAPLDQQVKVHVSGKPVAGLRVQLGTGAAIAGTISGLGPETLPSVEVRAFDGRGNDATATVDRRGAYKLSGILPGTWNVTASIASTGQQTRGQVALETGAPEARLDLQFGGGLTLSGRAVQGDLPVKGAVLYARGTNVDHSGWGRTDADGAFRMEGLEPGTYTVELRVWETGLSYDQSVDLTASKDVTLTVPTAKVVGRIVDGADGRPVAGVALTLGRRGENAAVGAIMARGATSDLNGRFEIASVSDGDWTINAAKTGYAAGTAGVTVTGGHVPEELTISLDSTEGLSLDVHLPSGRVPDTVDIAVLDPSGSSFLAGTYATGENGRVRLSTIPPGRWDLVVSAGGSGVGSVSANVPGPALAVQLPPACGLKVTVPALAGSNTAATAKIQGADGRTFRSLGWMADATGSFRLAGGRLELDTLPPGTWSVQVATSDGRTWNGTSQTQPGTAAELTLQ